MNRLYELIDILNHASNAYYNNQEIMSDYEYDSLYDELLKLESETGIQLATSPTKKVGYETISALQKSEHESPMLSLDKTKDINALLDFLGEHAGVLAWKLDGISISLVYENGELIEAKTRGNGIVGEIVTHNARVFINIPVKIPYNGRLIVRGEAVISYDDFLKINEPLEVKYKNPRNLCSGTVRQLDSQIAAQRNVQFFAFGTTAEFEKKSNQLEWLKQMGFFIAAFRLVYANNLTESVDWFKSQIENMPIATDGLVLTYDDIQYSQSLGRTSKFPKDSLAFKWADETAETALIDIEWSTSRTGLINPVAIFEPVELEGTTVNRASLHNVSIVKSLKLGIGDNITVYKANMIIPQIAENLSKTNTIKIPDTCPVCKSPTEIIAEADSETLYCTNNICPAVLLYSISHFVSRDAMNITGLSTETIQKFINNNILENIADIFFIEKHKENIIKLDGFSNKSYEKLVKSIEISKQVNIANFIYALGIRHVGLANAKLLCDHFDHDIQKIFTAPKEELLEVKGFGEAIAQSITNYFSNNMYLVKKVLGLLNINIPVLNKKDIGIFVITGSLFIYENRKSLQDAIEKIGGKVTSSVTSKTTALINNDSKSNSSKNKKAIDLNIPILTEQEFIDNYLNE